MTCRKISLQGIVYLLLLLHGEDLVGQTGNSLGNGSVHNPQNSAGFRDLPGQRGLTTFFLIRENVLLILTRRVPETKR